MEENKEKKQIKMNLWTFYVLVASIVILIGATILGWVKVAELNAAKPQTPPPAIERSAN
ncbi:MAG: hypothetical protein IJ223_03775 [Clostridia bacterium]|nr:hypothetical protein [Clostridia bacterium]